MSDATDEIRDLLVRYCFLLDDYRLADLAALFTADGVWQASGPAATGPQEIEALLRTLAPDPSTGAVQRHLSTNALITLDGADRARARSYYTVIRPAEGDPAIAIVGDYHDELVRTPAGWRFAKRVLTQVMRRGG